MSCAKMDNTLILSKTIFFEEYVFMCVYSVIQMLAASISATSFKFMARQKNIPAAKPKTVLIKPREVFKNELLDRIAIGQELFGRPVLDLEQLSQSNKDVYHWENINEEIIKRSFNNHYNDNNHYNEYYDEYSKLNTMSGMMDYLEGVNTNHPSYKLKQAKQNIENSIGWLKRLVEKLPWIEEEASIGTFQTKDKTFFNQGFLVHGHNQERKYEVARFIENDLKRKVIILHEQPNKGRTIIEKFESYSSVDFAVALWTADDVGKANAEENLKARSRQNVIFETGFFIGKVGRQNVIVLYENGVEVPSDYSGVIFIPLSDNWKDDLRKEIEAIYEIGD